METRAKFIEVDEHENGPCELCMWSGGSGVERREEGSVTFVCRQCIRGLKYPEREESTP